ncbi:MAG: T9SS type A sorting domain-containing protein [Sphingobacteriaceae bacterium]|nr:T9SS type A sorting domain-containing protein [Sphingobacteriaceae bacterium]
MKKSLLTIFGALACMTAAAQVASPSWTIVQNSNFPIPSAGIRYMDAVSPTAMWASGYDGTTGNVSRNYCWVTRTNDGGASFVAAPVWTSVSTPVMGDTSVYAISNIDAMSGTTAWVGAYKKISGGSQGGIFKTTDGGANWVNMTSAAMFTNATSFCNYVFFFTPNVAIAAGDPNPSSANEHDIWRSTDGGTTWTQVPGANIPNPTSGEFGITNVYEKFGSANAWLGTNKGRIFYTTDAGVTWNVTTVNASNTISDIAFYDAMNGIAMTFAPSSTVATVYNTTDGGVTWNVLTGVATNADYGRNDVCGIPGTSWFASCGAGTGNTLLSFSTDNGNTWNNWGSTGIQYLTIDFVDPSTAWAGTFSDQTMANLEGFYKFNGGSLLQAPSANFTVTAAGCVSTAVMPGNQSTGNPNPTYTWTSAPAGAAFSSTAAASPTVFFSAPGVYTITLVAANSSSTSTVSRTINVSSCTGLSEAGVNEFNFVVSPNPGKDVFHVSLPSSTQPYNVTVTNVLGSVVYTTVTNTNSTDHSINLSGNKTGVYFMTISNNGNKTTKKIIIE